MLEMPENGWNGWKWLKMAGNVWNGWKLLEMAVISGEADKSRKLLEITRMAGIG